MWDRLFPTIVEHVADLARTLSTQLVERFPNKELLEALSIFQLSFWDGPMVGDFDKCIDVLADFYGVEKTIVFNGIRVLTRARHRRSLT